MTAKLESQTLLKQRLAADLVNAREKTLMLLDPIPDALLNIRVHDFYSPIGWHFGHIAMTEEYWALTRALGREPIRPDYSFLFANIPENPKDNRVHLPGRSEILSFMDQTRTSTLAALQETDLSGDNPLIAGGYAWDFAHQHECQHQETIVELLQLLTKHTASSTVIESEAEQVCVDVFDTEMVAIPGGTYLMGSNEPNGYDNEKRLHSVQVAPFYLDKTPVVAAQWVSFIEGGGYRRPELWTKEGWDWRCQNDISLPEYWHKSGHGYGYYGPRDIRSLLPREPVSSLSWYEADAYARWIGKRLPTESEWEYAASFDPTTGQSRRYPWGNEISEADQNADCGLKKPMPSPIGTGPVNALGLYDMAGKVWEWTSTPFLPYPGFNAFPYDGYSKDHMDGTHYCCRGGSWATNPRILRCSFRNWYIPSYRQGFLGLRCAKSL